MKSLLSSEDKGFMALMDENYQVSIQEITLVKESAITPNVEIVWKYNENFLDIHPKTIGDCINNRVNIIWIQIT